MSLALARKYRPNLFEDLIGQDSISQTLSLALDTKRLSHAYLFSGLRGSGKTSTARIFAKALLCEKGETSRPCNTCIHCTMANESRHMDIVEMDAASTRGIDDIKELIEHTKYQPSSGRYKIFIIDEVHMLTNQAFNALLKTLEEPPSFVKFILATTDPLKLPPTILSRTQHFRFKKIPEDTVKKHLMHILDTENIDYEQEAVQIIARSGAGSLRDSLTLLDQAIVYSKNFVDLPTVTQMLGIIEPSLLKELIEAIVQKDQPKIFDFLTLASEYEAEMILDELTLYLKALLFEQNNTLITPLIIERFFRVIADSKELLKLGSNSDFVLALTIFKMIESMEIKEIDAMIKTLEKELHSHLEKSSDQPNPTPTTKISQQDIPPTKTPVQEAPASTKDNRFNKLIQKIYDRDDTLGECFERTIRFDKFENGSLYWISTAQDKDKALLRTHYGIIRLFVQEIYGADTKIVNTQSEEKRQVTSPQETSPTQITPNNQESDEPMSDKQTPQPIKPENHPFVQEAISLFEPKKVRIIEKKIPSS